MASNSCCEVITKESIFMEIEDILDWSTREDKLVLIYNSVLLCCKWSNIKA